MSTNINNWCGFLLLAISFYIFIRIIKEHRLSKHHKVNWKSYVY